MGAGHYGLSCLSDRVTANPGAAFFKALIKKLCSPRTRRKPQAQNALQSPISAALIETHVPQMSVIITFILLAGSGRYARPPALTDRARHEGEARADTQAGRGCAHAGSSRGLAGESPVMSKTACL